MRHHVRHLPAYLGLLIPLGVLAWLGSSELGRQSDRADKAMFDHATSFLGDAVSQLERGIRTRTARVSEPFEFEPEPLVYLERAVARAEPFALGLVVLDETGDTIHPSAPPSPRVTQRLLSRRGTSPELRAADQLLDIGDRDGARALLQDYLEQERSRRSGRAMVARTQAQFRLGTIMLAERRFEEAERLLRSARSTNFRDPVLALMTDTALAELALERDDDAIPICELMERIASGEHHEFVADELLLATLRSLDDRIPEGNPEKSDARSQIELDVTRRRGREFAREFLDFARESVRRQLRGTSGDATVFVCHGSPSGPEMLVLRRITDAERRGNRALLEQARWVGLRFDARALIDDSIGELMHPGASEFFVTIDGPDGTTIELVDTLPDPTTDDEFVSPTRRSIGGLTLHARPADYESYLTGRQASTRNTAILLVVLCLTAGGGAFFLVRSAHRESEIAQLKMQLVSRISHELKTPLALIRMYSETLSRGRSTTPDQAKKFTDIITREAERLTTMVERVLDLSRRESGQESMSMERCNLSQVTMAIADAYAPRAKQRGVMFHCRIDPGVYAEVDATAYESTLLNLLDNAVKYSDPESDDCRVDLELSKIGEKINIEVRDRGVGIPDGELDLVFTSFYRASNAAETPGAGLGLNLVKGFADAHEGTIQARRREGGGTTFCLRLPASKRPENQNG